MLWAFNPGSRRRWRAPSPGCHAPAVPQRGGTAEARPSAQRAPKCLCGPPWGSALAFSLLTELQPSRGAKGGAGDPGGAEAGTAGGPALVSPWERSGPEGMAEPQRRPAEAGACGSAVPGEGDPGTGPLCPFALKMRKPVHAQEELRLRARSSAVLAGTAYKVEHRCCAKPSPTPRSWEPQLQHEAALCFPPPAKADSPGTPARLKPMVLVAFPAYPGVKHWPGLP